MRWFFGRSNGWISTISYEKWYLPNSGNQNYSTENQRMSREKKVGWKMVQNPFGMVYLYLFFGPTFFACGKQKIPHQNVGFLSEKKVGDPRPSVTLPPWLRCETQDPHEVRCAAMCWSHSMAFPCKLLLETWYWWGPFLLPGKVFATWKGLCSPKRHTKWIKPSCCLLNITRVLWIPGGYMM